MIKPKDPRAALLIAIVSIAIGIGELCGAGIGFLALGAMFLFLVLL